MEACEPGQGRKPAAISSHLFVRWVSHPTPDRRAVLRNRPHVTDGSSSQMAFLLRRQIATPRVPAGRMLPLSTRGGANTWSSPAAIAPKPSTS